MLWCEHKGDLLFCMPGSTYSAHLSHPGLKVGDVIGKWACVAKNRDGGHTFREHRPDPLQVIRQQLAEEAEKWTV